MDIYQKIIDLYKQYGTIRDVEREIGSEASKGAVTSKSQ
jgi:hypothetical protein